VVVTDGPHVETKEILGGFVILETDTEEEALQIASEWPALSQHSNATVQLQAVKVREP
jgi:PhnB protein